MHSVGVGHVVHQGVAASSAQSSVNLTVPPTTPVAWETSAASALLAVTAGVEAQDGSS